MRLLENRIAVVAQRQHGVVTRTQLLELGLSPGALRCRVRSGTFRILHRGVYLVGPIMPPHARAMAAALACGPEAIVSHRSAAALWDLVPPPPPDAPVEITAVGTYHRSRASVRIRRTSELAPDERCVLAGIPVTAPGRTLIDLATVVDARRVERAVARAERESILNRSGLAALIERYAGKPGVRVLRSIVHQGAGPALTRSEAEERFIDLVRTARLPMPETNVRVGRYEVDFLWRSRRLAVEVDGYRFHSARARFEHDRRRASHLASLGIQVIPLTWSQIVDDGVATAVQLGQALLRAEQR